MVKVMSKENAGMKKNSSSFSKAVLSISRRKSCIVMVALYASPS